MARVSGLRGALATCLRTLAAAQGACSGRGAALSSFVDNAPSTSYGAAQPAARWSRGGRQHSSLEAATAAAVTPPRQAVYQLVIVTGDVRGAGSPAPAVVKLVGTGGCTLPVCSCLPLVP